MTVENTTEYIALRNRPCFSGEEVKKHRSAAMNVLFFFWTYRKWKKCI